MPFINLNDLQVKEPAPGFKAVFVHSEKMTVAYWNVESGAELPEHSHPHEQIANVIDGKFELLVGEERRIIEPGEAAVIPSNVVHGGRAVTACRLIDIFCPVREDYR
jgi:quercetin dioxygenase-like cupin family protein